MKHTELNFNIDKINKELKRIYGISNPNVVKTVLKEAAAPELLEACIGALEMCQDKVMPTENDLTIMSGRIKQAINKAL